jgi:hypothetical protein
MLLFLFEYRQFPILTSDSNILGFTSGINNFLFVKIICTSYFARYFIPFMNMIKKKKN